MEGLYPRCCGLDIHKRMVVACLVTPGQDGTPVKTIQTCGTMTEDRLALSDWLLAAECTHVAITWRWSARASAGSPSPTCWRTPSTCCW